MRPSGDGEAKIDKWFQPSLVVMIIDEASKAYGLVAWYGALLHKLWSQLALPLLRIPNASLATLSL